jgi:hypothetical protein
MNIRSLTAMAAVAAALTIAAQARADVMDTNDFYLTQGEEVGGVVPTPIADSSAVEVLVTATGPSAGDFTSATVEFKAPTGSVWAPIWINVNDAGSYSNFTASVSPGLGLTFTSGSEDSFGAFNLGTGGPNGPTGDSTVTITLTAEDSYFWTSAANVLTPSTGYAAVYGHGFEAVTAQQFAGVPAPSIGHGLPGILAVVGVLFGAGLLERGRKRRSPGTAISQAAG